MGEIRKIQKKAWKYIQYLRKYIYLCAKKKLLSYQEPILEAARPQQRLKLWMQSYKKLLKNGGVSQRKTRLK